ncbi:MAG: hypothetical protein ACQES1_07165 [Bacteroidota bacterium]
MPKRHQIIGLEKLSRIYPFVFLGYAIAGITGPLAGGLLFDSFGNFTIATTIAATLSLAGGSIFLVNYLRN